MIQTNMATRLLLRKLTSDELAEAEVYASNLAYPKSSVDREKLLSDLSVSLFHYYYESTDILLMDGAFPVEIDEAMVGFEFNVGPYEIQDTLGLERFYQERRKRNQSRDPKRRYIPIADRMVEEGRLGRPTNVGWYRYPGGKGKVDDPLVEDLVAEESHFAKVARREFSVEEIQERVICALVNASADRFDEFPDLTIYDLDLVINECLSFPVTQGGLIFYANKIGLEKVSDRISVFAQEDPIIWKLSSHFSRLRIEN